MNKMTAPLIALGAAIASVAISGLWLIATGYRVDAEGTTASVVEMLLGWGGIAVGIVLATGSSLVLARSGSVPRTHTTD